MAWIGIVNEKITELELIASWASQTNLARVRDYCRQAQAELKHELERIKRQEVK